MTRDLRTERKGRILAVRDLPTLPNVLEEVTRLVERADSSTEEVAKLISMGSVSSRAATVRSCSRKGSVGKKPLVCCKSAPAASENSRARVGSSGRVAASRS